MSQLFSIGYATLSADDFIAQLQRYGIQAVADPRRLAYEARRQLCSYRRPE